MSPNVTSIAIGTAIFLFVAAVFFFPFGQFLNHETDIIDRPMISDDTEVPSEEIVSEEKPDVSDTGIKEEKKVEPAKDEIPVKQNPPKISSPSPMVVVIPPIPVFLPATTTEKAAPPAATQEKPRTPEIDENAILRAVVKIQCPATDGIGKSIGSGFVLKDGLVVTVAHLLMDSGSKTCDVIFPKDRFPIHYLKGEITEDFSVIRKRFEDDGIDLGFLRLPVIAEYDDARTIFGNFYPALPYPVCDNPSVIGDVVYHYGYPSNFQGLNYLSRMDGIIVSYADIRGTSTQVSADGGATYRAPDFSFTDDEKEFHPYAVSQVGIFYGSSGGLAFDASKACILGVNHGFGKGSTLTYSIFLNLGWKAAGALIP
ncbi:MAG: hypothetical protein UY60_C0019G0009 [Parcubacteria group bacterium GW2011_GWB1_50_9]|nr:MAG: hypothetical protein UY60_C0019G0009 [Parcubacteria group bacterium GW2011_GWB1_50_9]